MFNWLLKVVDRIFAAAGALIFSQIPLFMVYYAKELKGHVDELQLQIESMTRVAAANSKTLAQYIQKFITSADVDFSSQGHLMQEMVDRWDFLTKALQAFHSASLWERPLVFFKYFNGDIAQSTLKAYEIGVPLSLEGAVYALTGIFFGLIIFYLVKQATRAFVSLFRRPKNPPLTLQE